MTSVESKVIFDQTEWMRANPQGLRLLDIRKLMPPAAFANEILRRQMIGDMGSQIALDAFKRGLGVMALAKPQYRVQFHMGARDDALPRIGPEPDWTTELPPASLIEPTALVEIMLEAYGFPIGIREV